MINLQNKTVLLPGGNGFFGRSVTDALKERGTTVIIPARARYDLRNPRDTHNFFRVNPAQYVINLAANTGGITYNKTFPADLFVDNIRINTNVLEACKDFKIEKTINITTSCSYPDGLEVLKEPDYWNGKPNGSVEFFGIAKRASESYARALNKQYGTNIVTLCITNLYGPGDRFDEGGKVTSSLIKKFVTAKQEKSSSVTLLGTGMPRRELMHVRDAAEGVVRSLESYEDSSLPLNIGTGSDISIGCLAMLIKTLVGYEGKMIWDTSAGDGQMKKLLDVSRMHKLLDYYPSTLLDEGLEETINWYLKEQECL